jgi:6-phosphogluconolactonase
MSNTPHTLIVTPDAATLAERAARSFTAHAAVAIAARGRFTVALSGGSTPRAIFHRLASEPFRAAVDWNNVFIFWGDERSVPPDHAESNYRMAREALLDPLEIPQKNYYRMEAEHGAGDAATRYRRTLVEFFGEGEFPRFDLIHLGMGDDGHTASLFPETAALAVADVSVTANPVEKLSTERITFTAPLINQARSVEFFVAGASKAAPLAAVLEGPAQPHILPSQLVRPTPGDLTWFVDASAAAKLTHA